MYNRNQLNSVSFTYKKTFQFLKLMLTNLDCFTNAIQQVTRGRVAGKKRHFMYPWIEVYVIWIYFGYRILPIAKIGSCLV